MAEHNKTGEQGEELAVKYLITEGYTILERNWSFNKYEIDIIARHKKELVIIEVRSRSTEEWEHPKDSITSKKIRNIVNATEAYIMQKDLLLETRFDVISVLPNNGKFKVEHIKEAFHPPLN